MNLIDVLEERHCHFALGNEYVVVLVIAQVGAESIDKELEVFRGFSLFSFRFNYDLDSQSLELSLPFFRLVFLVPLDYAPVQRVERCGYGGVVDTA